MALELKRKKKEKQNALLLSEALEEESMINQTLKDEIEKEIKINAQLESDYQKRIIQLQNTATSLCKFIEIQKKKNADLQTIIRHFSQNHKTQGSDNVEELTKKLQKLQYDFDQIVQKQNQSHAQITDIREKVNANRTERVIYSGVFRNIEREIRESEEEFKALLIERFHAEKRKEQIELQYQKNKEDAAKRVSANTRSNMKSMKELEMRMLPARQTTESVRTHQLKQTIWEASRINDPKDRKFLELDLAYGIKRTHKNEQLNPVIITFKKIESDTGLEAKQVLNTFLTISQTNDELFNMTNKLSSEIDKIEYQLNKLTSKKHRKSQSQHLDKTKDTEIKKIQSVVDSFSKKIQEEEEQIAKTVKQQPFIALLKLLNIDIKDEQSMELCEIFQQLDDQIESVLEYRPKQQERDIGCLEEMKEEMLYELIDHSDKNKECEKIMMRREMQEYCQKEFALARQGKKVVQKSQPLKKKK